MAGTSFPINREYTAQLLGFDGIITNTLDAVATRDYLLELAADFSTMGSTCRALPRICTSGPQQNLTM